MSSSAMPLLTVAFNFVFYFTKLVISPVDAFPSSLAFECHDGIMYNVSVNGSAIELTETAECCLGFIKVDQTCHLCDSDEAGCSLECPSFSYGPACTLRCNCTSCDPVNGMCQEGEGFLEEALRRLRSETLSSTRAVLAFCLIICLLCLVTALSSFIAYHYYYRPKRRAGDSGLRTRKADDENWLCADSRELR